MTAGLQGHLQSQAPAGVGVGEGGFGAVYGQAQLELAGPGLSGTRNLHGRPPHSGRPEGSRLAGRRTSSQKNLCDYCA
jgi:hypothetical protein